MMKGLTKASTHQRTGRFPRYAFINFIEGDPCTIKNSPGICTNQDQCPQLRLAFVQGHIRNEEIPRCGYTRNKEVICCPTENLSVLTQSTQRLLNDRVDGSAAIEFCRELQNSSVNELEFHVVNGLPVGKNEYRFMASIGYRKSNDVEDDSLITFHCGGTLISDRFILTAAHCVADPRNVPNIVLLGTMDLYEAHDEMLFEVKTTHIHPDSRPGNTYNDIALIELENPIKFTASVYPLCLYTHKQSPPDSWKTYVAGWGRTEKSSQSNRLFKAELSIVPTGTCKSELGQMVPSRRLSQGVQETQICARGNKRDACEGDSGGPLIYESDEKILYAGGITVAGFDCGGNMPGLYTRIASYLNFIENIVWPRKI